MRDMSKLARTQGPLVVVVGGALLLGAAYTAVCHNCPRMDIVLGMSGAILIALGVGVNYWVVRRRVSKRGYFDR